MNILIIEDDRFLCAKIRDTFTKVILTNRITEAYCLEDFERIRHTLESYDIIILDLEFPPYTSSGNGYNIIRYIREGHPFLPIVVFSGNDTVTSMRTAFWYGANDYIIKPIRLCELEVRICNWFAQYTRGISNKKDTLNTYGDLIYDACSHIFLYRWAQVDLTKRDKYILFLFFTHPEALLSREYLTSKIWGDHEPCGQRNISACIIRLKKSLTPIGISDWIENVRGEGYRFSRYR